MSLFLRSPLKPQTLTPLFITLRSYAVVSSQTHHPKTHIYIPPSSFLRRWVPPKNPKEAQWKLAMLHRQYEKQVKKVREEAIQEVDFLRVVKRRKDEEKKGAIRVANEKRKAAELKVKKLQDAERKLEEENSRQMLLKEREEKLEYWKKKREPCTGEKGEEEGGSAQAKFYVG